MSEIRHRVFVYGTLRSGGSNHHRMAGAVLVAPASVRGRLYRIDWYPGVVLDAESDAVVGEVYDVDGSMLAALDEYEGSEYRRVEATAALEDGNHVAALIWEWRLEVDEARRIESGDWLEAMPSQRSRSRKTSGGEDPRPPISGFAG
ncbi:gamma-glutamylcyclotransferase [Luteolibacter ambystomatis]|uniref:Gamma-glutamylcyclotransferase family protein n=1 Tax=Luteolibacter ambystomatis TaxID=2824561 RepID=A0A975J2R4_9BACT|nr:gamma-glutamylcyclotransferase family protein [Luteolibacter ambystomatis]QUE52938.1 gamma-glutamylcyclotransferase [Luteolibacter ambystomatis]